MQAFFSWLFRDILEPTFWFQPLFYALHGWVATEMAIWLLFHPYEAKFIPGTRIQLPMTPGIFHRGRANLTASIAETVTRTLLTEEDIHKQTEKLVTEDNLIRVIDVLLDSMARELQNPEQLRQIYRYGDEVLPGLITQAAAGVIESLEGSHPNREKTRAMLEQLLAEALPGVQIPYAQAEFLTDTLFGTLITPAAIRKVLADGLTDQNIALVQKNLSRQIGGWKGFMVRWMGADNSLRKLRDFLNEEPEEAEARITELLDQVEMRERLAERLAGFTFAQLPEETQSVLRAYIAGLIQEGLVDHKAEIVALVAEWSRKGGRLLINKLLQTDLRAWLSDKRPELKRELARFIRRYLNRELELMVGKLLPAINISQMIVEKLEQFSASELEAVIYGICRRELRWLAFLGAFLGFWLGLVSNIINYFLVQFKGGSL